MRNRKHLATGFIATVLIATNITTGAQLQKSKEKVDQLQNEISKYKINETQFKRKIFLNGKMIQKQQNEITEYKKRELELKKLTIRNEKNIINLKKELSKVNMKHKRNPSGQKTSKSKIKIINFEVTAYTSGYESTGKNRGEAGYGMTASGNKATEGRTISCPNSMKFGTKVNIEGIGLRVCEDRGSAITEGHLDVYMNRLSAAKHFGRKILRVKINK